jgi:predicted Ser/Thr protein kinase
MNAIASLPDDAVVHPTSDDALLKRGERLLEPDVYRARINGRATVVKDYRRYRGTVLAPLARLLVLREARVLRQLSGWKHAPALVGVIGGLALGMEYVNGQTLSSLQAADAQIFDQLQGALDRLHASGITHNDLHGTNVMVAAGVPVLIDFTSAWRIPRWRRNNPIARQLRRSDYKNLLKMRARATGQKTPPELAARVAEPHWVQLIRGGWKRAYSRFKSHTA